MSNITSHHLDLRLGRAWFKVTVRNMSQRVLWGGPKNVWITKQWDKHVILMIGS